MIRVVFKENGKEVCVCGGGGGRFIGVISRKRDIGAQMCLNSCETKFSAAHIKFYSISLRQKIKILWALEISSFYVMYLTFDLDL